MNKEKHLPSTLTNEVKVSVKGNKSNNEIEEMARTFEFDAVKYAELKKKYTEVRNVYG